MGNAQTTGEGRRSGGAAPPRLAVGAWPWLLVALVALAAAGCGKPATDPELRIREALVAAEAAAESGDLDALADWVARDYGDAAGRDRRTLLLNLRGLLMRYPRLELIVTVREIEVLSPQLATVRLELLSAGAGPYGLSADAFPLTLSLRDDGRGWRVTRAEWGRSSGSGI
jgi:hypothetical protein